MARRPAFRMAHLAELVWRVAADGLAHAAHETGDRTRAVRAVIALQDVARLPSPGLARTAEAAAARIMTALGHTEARFSA